MDRARFGRVGNRDIFFYDGTWFLELSVFTLSCSHHHHPSPELVIFPD